MARACRCADGPARDRQTPLQQVHACIMTITVNREPERSPAAIRMLRRNATL